MEKLRVLFLNDTSRNGGPPRSLFYILKFLDPERIHRAVLLPRRGVVSELYEREKVAALDAGANDYVTKPFGVQELMARVRALLRSHATAGEAPPVFDDGRLRVDLARREVFLQGEPVQLARKEYALLALLLQHSGRVVTQPQMLRTIWGDHHDHDTHYLRVLAGKLRQKLGDDAATPRWIATEPGVGLRFVGRSIAS